MTFPIDTYREEGHIENHKVKCHAQRDSSDQKHVLPNRQTKQTLILRQRVGSVEHLHRHENRQADRRRPLCKLVGEHFTSNLGEQGRTFVEVALRKPSVLALANSHPNRVNLPIDGM